MEITMDSLTKLIVETQQSSTKLLVDGMTAQNACAWRESCASAVKTSANRELHNSENLEVAQTSFLKAFNQSPRGQPLSSNQCPIEESIMVATQQAPSLDMQLAVLGGAKQASTGSRQIRCRRVRGHVRQWQCEVRHEH